MSSPGLEHLPSKDELPWTDLLNRNQARKGTWVGESVITAVSFQ